MDYKYLALLNIGIWIGMLIGISFLEAPLKFRAPNMTTELGLGIGQLVFGALNKIEFGFSILAIVWLILNKEVLANSVLIALSIVICIVFLQSFWLLPTLDVRAESIINGIDVESSYHHLYYVLAEILKLLILMVCFYKVSKYE